MGMERYLSFSSFCKQKYGRKLYRAALDAGMTCPNRDGRLDTRGCIFCLGGSGDFAVRYDGSPIRREQMLFNHQDAKPGDYIAYFQSYTNTYAPTERLRTLFEGALKDPMFAGISVATRPDCLGEDVICLFKALKEAYPQKIMMIELGLQSMHEFSAVWMRRGYTLDVFEHAVDCLHALDIDIIVHVIIGLPGETKEMMLDTVRYLSSCHIQGIKLQLLHYLRGTDLGDAYVRDPSQFHVLSLQEYADIIADCIAVLDENIVIHRISGDGNGSELLAPDWSRDKRKVLNTISHTLKIRNITQGCRREL